MRELELKGDIRFRLLLDIKNIKIKKISSYVSSLLTWSNSGMGRGYSVSFIQLFDRK